jgi:hypothetical protein
MTTAADLERTNAELVQANAALEQANVNLRRQMEGLKAVCPNGWYRVALMRADEVDKLAEALEFQMALVSRLRGQLKSEIADDSQDGGAGQTVHA